MTAPDPRALRDALRRAPHVGPAIVRAASDAALAAAMAEAERMPRPAQPATRADALARAADAVRALASTMGA